MQKIKYLKSNMKQLTFYFLILLVSFLHSNSLKAQKKSDFNMVPIGAEAFEVMHDFFKYDKSMPLNPRVARRRKEPNYIREKIIFSSTQDNRVPGYLAIPKTGTAPYPCVLLLHGFNGSKENWWIDDSFISGGQLTEQLLKSGFAVMALDAQYHGERMANNDYETAGVFAFQKKWSLRIRDMNVQSVIDYRRAIDYLATRKKIDSSRIGMIGYSNGSLMTFNLAAIDHRIKVAVAAVTPTIKKQYSALADVNFAPYIKKQPFLMLMGKTDQNYMVEEAQKLHDLVNSDTKEIVFYESGHKLPGDWTRRAAAWIDKYLKP